jgi:hypothetical protein
MRPIPNEGSNCARCVHLTGGRKAARTGMFERCAGDGEHVARERALSTIGGDRSRAARTDA